MYTRVPTDCISKYNLDDYEYQRGRHCCNYHICVIGITCCTGGNSFHSIVALSGFLSNTSCAYGCRMAVADFFGCVRVDCGCCCSLWSACCKSDVFSCTRLSHRFNINSFTDCGFAPSTCGYEYPIRNSDSCADGNYS